MPDSPYLKTLRRSLAQNEEGVLLVHSDHDREMLERDIAELQKDIKRLEKWEAEPNRMGIS